MKVTIAIEDKKCGARLLGSAGVFRDEPCLVLVDGLRHYRGAWLRQLAALMLWIACPDDITYI